ncbi:MAG: hypothetical protein LRY41_03600 [Candidatus Pacebacteria bacterium]|nr:hypothetical protein [Candidatus Paceibacterota bacterium]
MIILPAISEHIRVAPALFDGSYTKDATRSIPDNGTSDFWNAWYADYASGNYFSRPCQEFPRTHQSFFWVFW